MQLIDGQGYEVPNKQVFRLACCDCGLVHDVVLVSPKLKTGADLGIALKRNKRATSKRRKRM